MAATTYAMLGQFVGSSWDNAFPQSPQNGTQDLDLIHIRGIGDQMLAVVNHAGAVSGGSTSGLTLTSVAVGTLALTSVAVASFAVTSVAVVGAVTTYNGTFTGGGANAFVGDSIVVLGFTTSGNNGTFTITGSTGTTITVATTTQANETHAATASVTGVSLVTYNGTITGGTSNAFAGDSVLIAGFTNSANNGTFTIVGSTISTFTVLLNAQVAETHAGTAQIAGVSQTTYNGTITGGAANALAGSTVTVTGFSTSGNNVTSATILSSTGSTIVVLTTTQANETHAGTASVSLAYTKGGTRIGTFKTFLDSTATLASVFANAFSNPSNQDVVQIVSPTGESVVNYIDYQGVSH